jgi:hypothetical protein
MQVLNNNYYKVLRFEGQMLRANLESLAGAVVLSVALYALNHSVMSIAIAALVTMVYRVYMSERFLRRAMGGAGGGKVLVEVLAYGLFISITSSLDYRVAFLVFCLSFAAYVAYFRDEFQSLATRMMRGEGP